MESSPNSQSVNWWVLCSSFMEPFNSTKLTSHLPIYERKVSVQNLIQIEATITKNYQLPATNFFWIFREEHRVPTSSNPSRRIVWIGFMSKLLGRDPNLFLIRLHLFFPKSLLERCSILGHFQSSEWIRKWKWDFNSNFYLRFPLE